MNDSLHSLVLAQAMGLYLLILAIIMLARAKYYQELISRIKADSSVVVFGASFGLVLGIVLVLVHNIWIMESEVLVTLVSWFVLIKSILWLAIPELMARCTHKIYTGFGFYLMVSIVGIIGILLMSHGFYHFM